MEPSSITLNIFSTGGAEFVIRYDSRPPVAIFPFPAADLAKLRFDGGAAVSSYVCVNPSTRGEGSSIGQQVRVTYRGDKKHGTSSAEGRLISFTEDATVLATADGVLTLRGELVETLLAMNPDEGGLPQLRVEYGDDDQKQPLVVSGFDPTLRYSVQHSVVLEPSTDSAGSTPAGLNISAQLTHTYPWPIYVTQITLTEFEPLPVQDYYAQQEGRMASAAAVRTKSASPPPVAHSSSAGSIVINRGVQLARAAIGPTVMQVRRVMLADAESHYLATLDPTTADDSKRVPAELVVRLKPDLSLFVPSGPAAVLIDMDPLPGRDHMAPADLRLGFFHNAWDSKNRKRAYHRLGATTQLTARIEETATKESTDDATGRVTVQHRLVMTNATPYPAKVKLWLTSRNILYSVKTSDAQQMQIQNLRDSYVRETEDEVAAANTYTLQVVLPVLANQAEASCVLSVVFNRA